MELTAFELRMNKNRDHSERRCEAEEASERFMCAAGLLPGGSELSIRMEFCRERSPRVLVFTDEGSSVTKKDVGWIVGSTADVWAPGRTSEEVMGEMYESVYALCIGKGYAPQEEKGERGINVRERYSRFSELLAALNDVGADFVIRVSGGKGSVTVSFKEGATLRLRSMISRALPGMELRAVAEAGETEKTSEADKTSNCLPPEMIGQAVSVFLDILTIWPEEEPDCAGILIDPDDIDFDDDEEEEEYGTPLEELDLSIRAYNTLKRANFDTIEDVLEMPEKDLMKVRNLGKKGAEEVLSKIKKYRESAKVMDEGRDPFAMLDELIGLAEVKEQVRRIAAFARMKREMAALGRPDVPMVLNMEFTGNPGTAKTTVARILAAIFCRTGLLKSSEIVEVGRAEIVAKYVGHTADNVKNIFQRARGRLLFIDEAYSLADDYSGGFGSEAITAIVQEMENHRDETIVIFAGYPNEMNGFFSVNPGLRSRVPFHISFTDYSAEEMADIVRLEAKKRGFDIEAGAGEKIRTICEAAKLGPENGNGRFCRNLVEEAILGYASRVFGGGEAPAEPDFTLSADDFTLPRSLGEAKKIARIGFAA